MLEVVYLVFNEGYTASETDWPRIAAIYDALSQVAPSPVVELNRAVAVGMAFGPAAGLEIIDALAGEKVLHNYQWFPSVRGDLLAKLGAQQRGEAGVRKSSATGRQCAGAPDAARAGARYHGLSRERLRLPRPRNRGAVPQDSIVLRNRTDPCR